MIDLHCHILPGIDDGPATLSESLAMAQRAVADGVRIIVATPHGHNGTFDNPPEKVREAVGRFQQRLDDSGVDLQVRPGSEVHIHEEMVAHLRAGLAGTVNDNGRYVLVELPFTSLPPGTRDALFRLKVDGFIPILAHPERNVVLQRQFDLFHELVGMGCLTQVTAMSITGELGQSAMACAHRLLEQRMAHIISSDAHGADGRPPVLSHGLEAAAQILGNRKEAEEMVLGRPRAILSGQPLDVPEPQRPQKKQWWRFWG